MDALELESDKRIDPDQLDVEALRVPEMYLKWAERRVDAREVADEAELHLETVKARLQLRVRKDPTKYGLDKPTEAAISATVSIHPKYVAAHEEYNRARSNAALMNEAVNTIEKKDAMLKLLVALHGQAYFAGPSVPHDLKEVYRERMEAVNNRVTRKQVKVSRKRGDRAADD